MKRTIAILLPLVLGVALAACENRNAKPLNEGFGNSVRYNMSLHIMNPEPYAGTEAPALDGKRAAEGMKRYESGDVVHGGPISTTSGAE
jgi:hypothetical protein